MGLKKQIIQFKNENVVAVYDSATAAAEAVGSTKSSISRCCLGKLKNIGGFTFKYSGEFTNQQKNDGDLKCPYYDKRFDTYNGLSKHVFRYKEHGDDITQEKLLSDCAYNGKRPKCKCGCGSYTDISYVNGAHFNDYVLGHASRIHNNWGHNEKAKENSAETRRRQFKSGERNQWNKGKSWKETYSEDEIKELRKMYEPGSERSKNIQKALTGKPKSPEHAEKCRENGRCENSILKNREKMRKMLAENKFSISSKIEKEFVKNCIESLGIEYSTQHYLEEIRHYCDVYIPEINTIIEFQGDYWHGNPKKYEREGLSDFQLKKVKKDEILREYCKKNGIGLIEVWESDYNRSHNNVTKMLAEEIEKIR